MGGGGFDTGASAARAAFRKSTGADAFIRTSTMTRATASCHESLDVSLKPKRECFDNDDNPMSVPIAVVLDVTGSMRSLPRSILPQLHNIVTIVRDRGTIKNPSICFAATGDAYMDKVPLQIGEFEADDEKIEAAITNFYLEGGGGGNAGETYELAMWFFANQVTTDHWNKRGQKGFLFVIGDEPYFESVNKDHIRIHCGVEVGEDVNTKAMVEKLKTRFEVFCIRPSGSSNFDDPKAQSMWEDLLGSERVMKIENWEDIPSVIAGTISVIGGMALKSVLDAMKDTGMSVGGSATTALEKVAGSAALSVVGTVDGGDSSAAERL